MKFDRKVLTLVVTFKIRFPQYHYFAQSDHTDWVVQLSYVLHVLKFRLSN
jgi:hypothetical protein